MRKNRFIKRLLLLAIFIMLSIAGQAQSADEIKRPSANAQQFTSIASTSVGLHTGQMSADISLFTLQGKGIDVPVFLAFSSAEITHQSEASPVGLGWSLLAGGVISVTIRDKEDIQTTSKEDIPWQYDRDYLTKKWEEQGKNSTFSNKFDLAMDWILGGDYAPDTYKYTFQGYSGDIVFKFNDNDKLEGKLYPDETFKIDKTDQGFKIRTDDGVEYYFECKEYNSANNVTVAISYFLSEIKTPQGGHVTLTYVDEIGYDLRQNIGNGGGGYEHPQITKKRLVRIDSDFEYAIFSKSKPNGALASNLSGFMWVELHDKAGVLIKGYELNSGSPFTNSNQTSYSEYNIRLRLNNIKEYDHNGNYLPGYNFEYDYHFARAKDSYKYCPIAGSNCVSASWAKCPGPLAVVDRSDNYGLPACWSVNVNTPQEQLYGFGTVDDYYDETVYDYFCLTQITFPAGNSESYTYEPHDYRYVGTTSEGILPASAVIGKRLSRKTILNKDGTVRYVDYKYNLHDANYAIPKNAVSSGILVTPSIHTSVIYKPVDEKDHRRFVAAAYTTKMPQNCLEGPVVCYTEVEEVYRSASAILGRKLYYFDKVMATPAMNYIYTNYNYHPNSRGNILVPIQNKLYGTLGGYPANIAAYNNYNYVYMAYPVGKFSYPIRTVGKVLKEITLNSDGAVVRKVLNEYSHGESPALYGYLVCKFNDTTAQHPDFEARRYLISQTTHSAVYSRLCKTTTTDYFPVSGTSVTDSITEVRTCNKSGTRVVSTTEKLGNGESITIENIYPDQIRFDTQTVLSAQATVLKKMVELNMINLPVQTVKKKGSKYIEGTFFTYKSVSGTCVVTDSIFRLENESGSPVLNPYVDIQGKLVCHSKFVWNQAFPVYDENMKPISISYKNKPATYLKWGHGGRYVIAKIDNYTSAQVNTNFALKGYLSTLAECKGSSDELYNCNKAIRENLPDNVLATTYTYDPVVGMTSETDPSGNANYSDYDSFGRLNCIRDCNNCVIEEMDYHWGSQTYVHTRTMLEGDGSAYIDKTVYYSDSEKPYQTVLKGITPAGKNLITYQEYDGMGRKDKSWLPIPTTYDYVGLYEFVVNGPSKYDNDSRLYSQTVYESSPLSRIVKRYGPGDAWGSSPVSTNYMTNTTSAPLNCINYQVNDTGTLLSLGNYLSEQLRVTETVDEDGNVSYVFVNGQDQVLLTRQMEGNKAHDTYYVYNDFGSLCFVLQPMYQEKANLDLYAFQYRYDDRMRCIEKKLPGVQAVKYVYDQSDRLVFSQDGKQRAAGKWMFYLYDPLQRLVVKGECSNTNTASAANTKVVCTRVNANSGLGNSGYTSSFSFTSPLIYLVNYYDDYNFRSLTGFNNTSFPSATACKGSLTGSVVTVLESGAKLYSANYYDTKGRMVEHVSGNLLGGYDTTSMVYTFTSNPASVSHVHTATGKITQTEIYNYTYDHADRLTKVEHTLNGTKVVLSENTYDELGRLANKSLHNASADMMGYTYNIRNWLTRIESPNLIMKLNYGSPVGGGNIASIFWKSGEEGRQKYTFTYDGLGRMLNADHLILGQQDEDDDDWGVTTGLMSIQTGRQIEETPLARENAFTERVTEYDKNGNILKLVRYGQTGANSYGVIDNLTMKLTGNQLNRVDDASTASAYGGGFEFKDAVKQDNEYAYDANGNLTQDLNKGIEDIQYNCLNLPRLVKFKDQSTITYTYAADGTKLRVEHKIGGSTTQTTYCSNVIYEDGTAKCLLTEEGYVSLDDRKYHYYLKDHQGNNRVLVNKNGGVEEINHYYPFGGVFASEENVQPYKYNGKELDTKKGLNWYDYGARMYDAAVGRFTTTDRFAEKYYSMSSYQYGGNNPVGNIDINGDSIVISKPNFADFVGAIYNGLEGGNLVMKFNNGVLDPTSIEQQAKESSDFFLQDLYEIATNEKMVEISFSDKNTYLMNGQLTNERFNVPMDDNSADLGTDYEKQLQAMGEPLGRGIRGNLGQTLVPNNGLMSGKRSTNGNVQVIINKNGSLNHRTVGLAHEFAHVILYLRNKPFGHTQPGVDTFVYGRASLMSKRLGYDY